MFGKWTEHVKSWRHTELGDRVMYITYEEMVEVKGQSRWFALLFLTYLESIYTE